MFCLSIQTLFNQPCRFLALKDVPSQDADGLIYSIRSAFQNNMLGEMVDKMVFLASDGASVNSGLKGDLVTKFCEEGMEWLTFVWCLSHRLELALEDSLKVHLTEVKKCLSNLFYLYRKLRELRMLHAILLDIYEFQNGQVKPDKSWYIHDG